jgi:hypothetical protein
MKPDTWLALNGVVHAFYTHQNHNTMACANTVNSLLPSMYGEQGMMVI